MGKGVILLVAFLFISGSSAIDIAKLLGLTSVVESPAAIPETPEQVPTEERQLFNRLGAYISPVLADIPTFFNDIRPTVTRTIVVQVTATHTTYPVCLISNGHVPPCSSKHDEHKEEYDPYQAYYVGENQALTAHDIKEKPELALSGHIPVPTGHHAYEHHYQHKPQENDDHESWQLKKSAQIPSESSRTARKVELDASNEAGIEDDVKKVPNPRFLVAPKLFPVTETKTLYVTKLDHYVDHHVTATVEAHNCIPDNLPFCPTKSTKYNTITTTATVNVPYPVYVEKPHPPAHKPTHYEHTPYIPPHNSHKPYPYPPKNGIIFKNAETLVDEEALEKSDTTSVKPNDDDIILA